MLIRDYFRSVEVMTPDQVRTFMNTHNPGEYNLVDVRQPREYEQEHLPGARLIPVAQLSERLNELDPEKTTITY